MPVFLLLGSEVVALSLLIGAYMGSIGLGFAIMGGSGLMIYPFYQRFYTLQPFLWVIACLGSLATLLWASYLDYFFDTHFIAYILTLIVGATLYVSNYLFVKTWEEQ
jgi:hypothetical protein